MNFHFIDVMHCHRDPSKHWILLHSRVLPGCLSLSQISVVEMEIVLGSWHGHTIQLILRPSKCGMPHTMIYPLSERMQVGWQIDIIASHKDMLNK